jgi:acyl-CoA synthetase (AMP-forming)/AMP-acid ligase II
MPCERSLRSLSLSVHSPDRFISDDCNCINIGDFQTASAIDPSGAHGRSVLVKTIRQLPAVLAVIELDGVARRIVLCPPDQWCHLPRIIQMASIDVVVTDDPDDDFPTVIRAVCTLNHPVRRAYSGIDTEWILLTSGTTGQPKLAIHTLSSLAGPLDDGLVATRAVWSTFYDIRRYGGLQMLLRALLGGGSMVLSNDRESSTNFLSRLGKSGVTHISGTPSHWRRALMSPAARAMSPTYVRLSGEIVDQTILDNLSRTYPGSNIAHAFASTEAGVAFDVRDGKAGFPASLIGNPDLKAELRVEGGTLHIRSSRTATSYIGRELPGSDGFIDTGDLVEKRGDRYYFVGRKEGVINVGGKKVHPEEVEAIMTQHPLVRVARVWARSNPVVGSLVAADVMLRADSVVALADVRSEVIDLCRRHLAAWKVPVSIRQVDSIELSPAGKVSRRA